MYHCNLTELRCAPPTCVVHYGAKGRPVCLGVWRLLCAPLHVPRGPPLDGAQCDVVRLDVCLCVSSVSEHSHD